MDDNEVMKKFVGFCKVLTPILIGVVEYRRLWAPTGDVIGVIAVAKAVASGFPGNAVVNNLPPTTAMAMVFFRKLGTKSKFYPKCCFFTLCLLLHMHGICNPT